MVNKEGYSQIPDDLLGSWISEQRNVMVKIVWENEQYKARVIWFDDTDDITRPMHSRTDRKNPVASLRNQKIIGLEVLRGLVFVRKCRCWQNGKIYDVQTGKTWSASVVLENKNKIRVRGFWRFEFIGRTMIFRRVKT